MKSNLISRESIHVYSDLSCYMYSVFDLILWRLSCRPCTVEKVSIQPSGVEPWVHLFSQNLCNYHPWSCGWYLFFLWVCVRFIMACPWDTCCRGNYYKGSFDYFDACLYGCLWIDLVKIVQHFVKIKMFWTSHYGAVFSFWGGVALVFIDRMMNSVYREIMIETIKIVGLTDDKAMES